MISKSSLLNIGNIAKPHGVSGEILVRILPEWSNYDPDPEFLFLELNGGLVPYAVQSIRFRNSGDLLVTLENVNSQEKVRRIQGSEVFIDPEEMGVAQEQHNEELININALVGYLVKDTQHGELGKVDSVADIKNNPLLEIDHKGKQILIPIHENFIVSLDRKERILLIETPEGLVDLFLE